MKSVLQNLKCQCTNLHYFFNIIGKGIILYIQYYKADETDSATRSPFSARSTCWHGYCSWPYICSISTSEMSAYPCAYPPARTRPGVMTDWRPARKGESSQYNLCFRTPQGPRLTIFAYLNHHAYLDLFL